MEDQIQYYEGEAAGYADASPLRKPRYFAVTGVLLSLVSIIYSFLNPYSIDLEIQTYITLSYVISWANQLCFMTAGWMMLKVNNGYIRQAGILMIAAMALPFLTDILYYASLIPAEYGTATAIAINTISYILLVASLIMFLIEGNIDGYHVYRLGLIYTVVLGLSCANRMSFDMSMYQTSYVFTPLMAIALFFAFKSWWRLLSDATPEATESEDAGSLISNITNQGVIGFIVSVIIMISIFKILSNAL
ncbi:MAG: hypothetical protein NC098_00355 [Lachnoclostridium sp.]|nr:hypothetical protein [Lachnoclostridium sp.]